MIKPCIFNLQGLCVIAREFDACRVSVMLFIFATEEQRDPLKPTSDELTEACLLLTTHLVVPVIRGAINLSSWRQMPGDGQNPLCSSLNMRGPVCIVVWERQSTEKRENWNQPSSIWMLCITVSRRKQRGRDVCNSHDLMNALPLLFFYLKGLKIRLDLTEGSTPYFWKMPNGDPDY